MMFAYKVFFEIYNKHLIFESTDNKIKIHSQIYYSVIEA